jgi:hypothetical protein
MLFQLRELAVAFAGTDLSDAVGGRLCLTHVPLRDTCADGAGCCGVTVGDAGCGCVVRLSRLRLSRLRLCRLRLCWLRLCWLRLGRLRRCGAGPAARSRIQHGQAAAVAMVSPSINQTPISGPSCGAPLRVTSEFSGASDSFEINSQESARSVCAKPSANVGRDATSAAIVVIRGFQQ